MMVPVSCATGDGSGEKLVGDMEVTGDTEARPFAPKAEMGDFRLRSGVRAAAGC